MRAATLIILLTSTVLAAGETPWVGYGGPNGSRIYEGVNPPTKFGEKDIAWTAEIPDLGWGHGSPIVVGDKVILGAEYDERHNAFPSLVAFNTKDGSVAWQALLDHTPALPNGARLKELWMKVIADNLRRVELAKEYRESGKDEAKKKEIEQLGYKVDSKWGSVSPMMYAIAGKQALTKGEVRELRQAAFSLETWRKGHVGKTDWCVGQMYATPASDGKRIYTTTALGGFFAHDLDGKQLWCTASPGQQGEYCRNGRSPILWTDPESGKTLLISDITNLLRAFDAATGEILWTSRRCGDKERYGGKQGGGVHTIISPVVVQIGDTPVLWSAGSNCYRLPGGEPLKLEGWHPSDYGAQVLVDPDRPNVVYLSGAGEHSGWRGKGKNKEGPNPPAALELSLEGDTVKVKVLWHGGKLLAKYGSRGVSSGHASVLVHQGRFYHAQGAILDAATGELTAGAINPKSARQRAVPRTRHLLCIANGHVYGLIDSGDSKKGAAKGKIGVWTLDGKMVSENLLPNPHGRGRYSYGGTFTFAGSSIYVRSLRHLVKVGK